MKDLLSRDSLIYLFKFLTIALGYAFVAWLSLNLVPSGGSGASLVWPVSAVGLAVLYFFGYEFWPALFLPFFLLLLTRDITPPLAIAVALGNTIESLVGVYILHRLEFRAMLARMRDTIALVVVAGSASFVSATVITVGVALFGLGGPFNSMLWFGLWVGHAVSILSFAPFALRWGTRPQFRRSSAEVVEGVVVFLIIAALSFFVFWTPYGAYANVSLLYVLVIPLIWASLRTGPRGISLALLLLAIIGATGVLFGYGPISASPNLAQALFGVQVLIGTLSLIFLLFTSITEERKDAVKELETHVLQLEQALTKIQTEDQAKADFIAVLAHELRNPLSPILSALELVRQKGVLPHNEEHLKSIASHVHMMARLLDDLLDISRISQKKLKLQRDPVELGDVITQSTEMTRPFIDSRHHTFTVSVPAEPVWLNADGVRLTQAFVNLLNNSAKYTDPGGTIMFKVTHKNDIVDVVVRDNGIGIARERLKYIFEPFGGAEGHERRPGGLRIGLSLAKRIIEMHGGTIEVKSDGPGKGSEFVVRLPLIATPPLPLAHKPAGRQRFSSEAIIKLTKASGSLRILVIDDNEPAAKILKELLTNNGHTATIALDGPEALTEAEKDPPEIALIDIGLPTMDGYEVGRRLRERFGKKIALVALTGYGQNEDKQRSKEAGFDEHLTKPVSIVDLEHAILEVKPR